MFKTIKKILTRNKMANVVYEYPKSSCHCYKCTNTSYSDIGIPSNLSIRNCETPSMFECYDRTLFRSNIAPVNEHGYTLLNPDVFKNKYASDFKKLECSGKQGCPKVQYTSTDPRLISAKNSGQVLTLDNPPIETDQILNTISTDAKLNGYGQQYRTYSDINAGQIMYSINKSRQEPFFAPNFTTSARVHGILYQDPMGAIKPQYTRQPLKSRDCLDTTNHNYEGGLSWIHDSMEHRQDLLALQMRKSNEQRWEPRYGI